jgi:Ca2+-binding EF-hand superfamily protein
MRRLILAAAASALIATIASSAFANQDPTQAQRRQQMRAGERRRPDAHLQRQRDPAERFKKLDANGDGTLSRAEWPRAVEIFDKLDANRDGALTITELQAGRSQVRRRRR